MLLKGNVVLVHRWNTHVWTGLASTYTNTHTFTGGNVILNKGLVYVHTFIFSSLKYFTVYTSKLI